MYLWVSIFYDVPVGREMLLILQAQCIENVMTYHTYWNIIWPSKLKGSPKTSQLLIHKHKMWRWQCWWCDCGWGVKSTSKNSSFILTAMLQAFRQHLTQFLPSGCLQSLHQKLTSCFTASCGPFLQKICHYNAIHVPESQHNL